MIRLGLLQPLNTEETYLCGRPWRRPRTKLCRRRIKAQSYCEKDWSFVFDSSADSTRPSRHVKRKREMGSQNAHDFSKVGKFTLQRVLELV